MANEERAPVGIGCVSTIIGLVVIAAVVVLALFVGFIALVVVAGLVVVGLIVWAVDRLLLALSPKRRERREAARRAIVWRVGGFTTGAGTSGGRGSGDVIDATAVEESPDPLDDRSDWGEPDPLGPG